MPHHSCNYSFLSNHLLLPLCAPHMQPLLNITQHFYRHTIVIIPFVIPCLHQLHGLAIIKTPSTNSSPLPPPPAPLTPCSTQSTHTFLHLRNLMLLLRHPSLFIMNPPNRFAIEASHQTPPPHMEKPSIE